MLVTINPRALKACALAASTEKGRYYLQGVSLEMAPTHNIMVATNGHILIAAKRASAVNTVPAAPEGTPPIIIPSTMIAQIKLTRRSLDTGELTIEGDRLTLEYDAGTLVGKAVDGTFPDWRRIVPASVSGEVGHYNPAYLALLGKAYALLTDSDCKWLTIGHNGEACALVDLGEDAIGAIMPCRSPPPPTKFPGWING